MVPKHGRYLWPQVLLTHSRPTPRTHSSACGRWPEGARGPRPPNAAMRAFGGCYSSSLTRRVTNTGCAGCLPTGPPPMRVHTIARMVRSSLPSTSASMPSPTCWRSVGPRRAGSQSPSERRYSAPGMPQRGLPRRWASRHGQPTMPRPLPTAMRSPTMDGGGRTGDRDDGGPRVCNVILARLNWEATA